MDVREVELRQAIEQALKELAATRPGNRCERQQGLLEALRTFRHYIDPDKLGVQSSQSRARPEARPHQQ